MKKPGFNQPAERLNRRQELDKLRNEQWADRLRDREQSLAKQPLKFRTKKKRGMK